MDSLKKRAVSAWSALAVFTALALSGNLALADVTLNDMGVDIGEHVDQVATDFGTALLKVLAFGFALMVIWRIYKYSRRALNG